MILSESLSQDPITVAYFSTPQCSVCKVLQPKVEAMLDKYKNVRFIYINSAEEQEVAGQYRIFAAPTVLIFVEGKESKRLSRAFSVGEMQVFIERMLGLMELD